MLTRAPEIASTEKEEAQRKAASAAVLVILFSLSASITAGRSRPLPAETIAARQKFSARQRRSQDRAVRSDRVILSWVGVSSFVAAFKGHVVILDA